MHLEESVLELAQIPVQTSNADPFLGKLGSEAKEKKKQADRNTTTLVTLPTGTLPVEDSSENDLEEAQGGHSREESLREEGLAP